MLQVVRSTNEVGGRAISGMGYSILGGPVRLDGTVALEERHTAEHFRGGNALEDYGSNIDNGTGSSEAGGRIQPAWREADALLAKSGRRWSWNISVATRDPARWKCLGWWRCEQQMPGTHATAARGGLAREDAQKGIRNLLCEP